MAITDSKIENEAKDYFNLLILMMASSLLTDQKVRYFFKNAMFKSVKH